MSSAAVIPTESLLLAERLDTIPYESKGKGDRNRGIVWQIKSRDDTGRQTMETLGKASDGWTERKANREPAQGLDAVEMGWRKPPPVTFEAAPISDDRASFSDTVAAPGDTL